MMKFCIIFVKSIRVNSNEVFLKNTMPDLSNYMDLIINPSLNNSISTTSKALTSEELSQAEEFSKIFSDISDVSNMDLPDDGTVKPIESSDKEKVFQSASQQFGPPLGVDIENFDYMSA